MERDEWDALFRLLRANRTTISEWEPTAPDPSATRCEQSRHRTLGHLRACQEQWMIPVKAFLERDVPNIEILHPWRRFDQDGYASVGWEEHLAQFLADRDRWLLLHDVDRSRGGKWNRKPDTVGGLTRRLVDHESYHIALVDARAMRAAKGNPK